MVPEVRVDDPERAVAHANLTFDDVVREHLSPDARLEGGRVPTGERQQHAVRPAAARSDVHLDVDDLADVLRLRHVAAAEHGGQGGPEAAGRVDLDDGDAGHPAVLVVAVGVEQIGGRVGHGRAP